jgi:hypothetical protein
MSHDEQPAGHSRGGLQRMANRGLERTIILVGLALLGGILAELVLLTIWFPSQGVAMWQAIAVEMVAGREAAIPIALGVLDRMRRIQADADQHRGLVRKLGGFGIFLFMLVPFLVNGPLVGAVAGRLTGMRTVDLIVPVVAATVIAAVAWTYFYDQVLGLAGDMHPLLPPILTAIIVGLVLGHALRTRDAAEAERTQGLMAGTGPLVEGRLGGGV